jgi:hypothetical protein
VQEFFSGIKAAGTVAGSAVAGAAAAAVAGAAAAAVAGAADEDGAAAGVWASELSAAA